MGPLKGASGYVTVYEKIHASLNYNAIIDDVLPHGKWSKPKSTVVLHENFPAKFKIAAESANLALFQ